MKILKRTLLILAALIVIVAIVFTIIYFTRFQTSATIQKSQHMMNITSTVWILNMITALKIS